MKIFNVAFEKSVGAVIFRKEGNEKKYLLLKYRSGQWDFPKGHVEENESEKETLFREVEEETGLTKIDIIGGFRTSNRFFYTAKGNELKERMGNGLGINIFKTVVYYLVRTEESGIVLNFENKEYVWVGFEDVLKMLSNDGSKKTIRKVREFLEK